MCMLSMTVRNAEQYSHEKNKAYKMLARFQPLRGVDMGQIPSGRSRVEGKQGLFQRDTRTKDVSF